MGQIYYSNGKILLTGEYLVMFGARALAFPLKYGQSMKVESISGDSGLTWKAFSPEGKWFEAGFGLPRFNITHTTSMEQALFLKKILEAIIGMNKKIFDLDKSYIITTETNFPLMWGLGSSSTLIKNLAEWAGLNPFELFYKVSKGSGYDIACAGAQTPIVYTRNSAGTPESIKVEFNKSFINNLCFVYSGRKMSTEQNITNFLNRHKGLKTEIRQISAITDKIVKEDSLSTFIELLAEHEIIMGHVLEQDPLQLEQFMGFNGVIKSLGAWGGDFLLAASPESPQYISTYFEQIGLKTIIPFNQIVLT